MAMLISKIPVWVRKYAQNGRVLFYALVDVDGHYSKKNNKQIFKDKRSGKMFISSSNRASANEKHLVFHLEKLKAAWELTEPINRPVWCLFRFHYKFNKNGKPTKRIHDLSNLLQGPEDALQKAGIIADDKLIESYDGSRRVHSKRNMIEISIMEHTDEHY